MRRAVARLISLVLVALIAALGGCAELPRFGDGAAVERAWQARREALRELQAWTLAGRLAVHNDGEAWNGTLHWIQRRDSYDIRLIAPLGAGSLRLHGDSDGVALHTSDGKVYAAQSGEALLREQMGWSVPLEGLRYWALGLPDPGEAAKEKLDDVGRLAALRQSGWDIAFLRYDRAGDGLDLPAKIFLKGRDLEVRVVVDRWNLGAPLADPQARPSAP